MKKEDTAMTTTLQTTGELATAIANGDVEVNPHMTPDQQKAFAAHVAFFDDVVAKGMAHVEAERRNLIASGLMTEDGRLIHKPALR